jgi:chromosome segregation ATPase
MLNVKDMTPEQIKDWLAEESNDPIQLNLQKEELTKQRDELQAANETLQTELDNLKAQQEADKEAHEAAVADKDAEIQTVNATVESLNATIAQNETEINTLTEANAALIADAHKVLVDRVVDARVTLGKITDEAKEEQITLYMERSDESLRDSLNDLMAELKTAPTNKSAISAGVPADVTVNPSTRVGERVEDETGKEQKPAESSTAPATDGDVLKSLLNRNTRK